MDISYVGLSCIPILILILLLLRSLIKEHCCNTSTKLLQFGNFTFGKNVTIINMSINSPQLMPKVEGLNY